MRGLGVWIEAMRPKTLPAALAPVALGSAAAWEAGGFHGGAAAICLGFALLVQIGTNFANDYLDGIRGSDTDGRIGPQRAVAAGLVSPGTMKLAAVAVLASAFSLGLGLIPFGGWWLLAVGAASVACAWLYTGGPYPLAYNGLGDVFVVLFFGLIAVGCTYYVQTGSITGEVWLLGLGCGLLTNNILVVNNFRDVEEDRRAAKRTLVVRFGRRWARMQYVLSVLWAGAVVIWLAWEMGWPVLLGLPPVGHGLWLSARLPRARSAAEFGEALKGSAFVVAAYGLFFSIGILLA
ncbi:MAG: 1,4-dihydroxy-2-naphthoate polyprenyltransferase [Opitutales bacterium]